MQLSAAVDDMKRNKIIVMYTAKTGKEEVIANQQVISSKAHNAFKCVV